MQSDQQKKKTFEEVAIKIKKKKEKDLILDRPPFLSIFFINAFVCFYFIQYQPL